MNESKTWSGAMEGRGAYNRHAGLQAAGGALALNALRHAAASVALDTGGQPIVIAEYGASQGRNSQLPMRVAITELRARVGSDRAVLVYHEDLPINRHLLTCPPAFARRLSTGGDASSRPGP